MARTGRPRKFKSAEELQERIDAYFADCEKRSAPYTISGLANWIDIDRQTLLNYEKNEEFFGTIKKAKEKIIQMQEEMLVSGQGNATGLIFSMKNNYGWKDSRQIDAEVSGRVSYVVDLPDE